MTSSHADIWTYPAIGSIEALEIAVEAYAYAYPLISMDVTRQVSTNVAEADREFGSGAPMNQFTHLQRLPGPSFENAAWPNADTAYSSLWFDVSREPLILRVPDSHGRYYCLSLLDYWSEVFASPGARTTGTASQVFAIVGPAWQGALPDGMRVYRCPTALGWMIGRTRANGASDARNAARFQAGLSATPWSAWERSYTPAPAVVDPSLPDGLASDIIARMHTGDYFSRFCELTRDNPPHAHDYPLLDRLRRIGLVPGQRLELSALSPEVRLALEKARFIAIPTLKEAYERAGVFVNNWRAACRSRGASGTDYWLRAGTAFATLGACTNEELVCASVSHDADGKRFDSSQRYTLTFAKNRLPPVRAFWSLTLYNDRQLLENNRIHRHTLGGREDLRVDGDGSITLYVQRDSPGAEEQNWLPAPKSGGFSLALRLYWPRGDALAGRWAPPPVRRLP